MCPTNFKFGWQSHFKLTKTQRDGRIYSGFLLYRHDQLHPEHSLCLVPLDRCIHYIMLLVGECTSPALPLILSRSDIIRILEVITSIDISPHQLSCNTIRRRVFAVRMFVSELSSHAWTCPMKIIVNNGQ